MKREWKYAIIVIIIKKEYAHYVDVMLKLKRTQIHTVKFINGKINENDLR